MASRRTQSPDTPREVEEVLFSHYREMPVWRKLAKVEELNRSCRQMTLVGLRHRHPNETEERLALRLAALRLGPALVRAAYGVELGE